MKVHDGICDDLENKLKDKSFVEWIKIREKYEKGECDALTKQGNRYVYYEVKSTDHPGALARAYKQTIRWSDYWHKKTKADCYGVYYTPTKMKIIAKNGYAR